MKLFMKMPTWWLTLFVLEATFAINQAHDIYESVLILIW
uniref:Uncharacterized protein n=1 Tax=Acrobeloides nanus TaxID=290746 RepID=A0A914D7D2_9BILA